MPEPTPFDRAYAALEARGPGRMIPDLSRITQLAALLGDPQLSYPSVHVTGTNGKGSTVRMIGALCAAAGISAGTYTSPHLQTVRERLTIAGHHISEARFAALYDEVAPFADLVDDQARAQHGDNADTVTFFELLTAMSFACFADAPVDVGIFEVGMGGTWDATNVVAGNVAVLNEIDVDHAELGSTPAEVATEKAGIVKDDSLVITASQHPSVDEVIARAVQARHAALRQLGIDFDVTDRAVAVGGQLIAVRIGEREIDEILLPLYGAHQARNAALALAAFAALTGDAFDAMDDDVIRHGLGAVSVPGRLEIVQRDPTVVLDGAHNPHGAHAAAQAIEESFGFRVLVLVVACLDDMDVEGILAQWKTAASHVIVTQAPSFRAAPLARMHDAAITTWGLTGVAVETAPDLAEALRMAQNLVADGDGILVTGSLHTVGAARGRFIPVATLDDDAVVVEPDDTDDEFDPLAALTDDE